MAPLVRWAVSMDCVDGCNVVGAQPEPEPEPQQAASAPKRGMLTRQEAEEMAAKTSEDIAAAKAAVNALPRKQTDQPS